jgi:hypothetical protein
VEEFINRDRIAIRYNKNKDNLGYDRNALLVFSISTGKYIHFISDEDIYSGEVLADFVRHLENDRPDLVHVVSYNIPIMPGLGRLPEYIGSPDPLMHEALSWAGNKAGYFIGGCWYVLKRQDVLDFNAMDDPSLFHHKSLITHVPIFIYCLGKSKKTMIYKKDYRVPGAESLNQPKIRVFSLPSQTARLYYFNYYRVIKECLEMGIMKKGDFAYFNREFFKYMMSNMLNLRARMYPELFNAEKGKIMSDLAFFEGEYSGIRLALLKSWKWLLFASPLPFHWVYRAFYFFKTRIQGQKRDDYHKLYREMMSSPRYRNVFENSEPSKKGGPGG